MRGLLGVWHGRERGDRWSARFADIGTPALAGRGLIVAGARSHGDAIAGLDGPLYRVGRREPLTDPAAELASEWLRVGERVLPGVRGEAAMVLWDPARRRGLVARDQLGIGCVYVRSIGGCVAFASELSSLLDLTGSAQPDEDSVACWLAKGELPLRSTLYDGIGRLSPGEALLFDGDRPRRWRYWAADSVGELPASTEAPAGAIRDAIVTAVRRRMPSDGSAATLLSGGLDSNVVAAASALGLGGDARSRGAYSAVFPDHPEQDESRLISATVAELGLRGAAVPVRAGSVMAGATDWTERYRLPLPTPNWFYQRTLMERMAADGVTVAFDGEGGDEVFGADRFLVSDVLRAGHPLRALRLVRRFPGAGDGPPPRAIAHFLTRYGVRGALSPSRHAHLRRPGVTAGPPWLAPWAAARAGELVDPWRWKAGGQPRALAHLVFVLTETADAIGARDYFRHKGDPSGIRLSHPLLDLDLVELVLSLGPEAAFDPYVNRPLLRASMRGWVPEPILQRTQKARFEPLFVDCMTGADAPAVTDLLGDPSARIRRWTTPQRIDEMFARGPAGHPAGPHRWADDGFRLAATEIWLRSLQ